MASRPLQLSPDLQEQMSIFPTPPSHPDTVFASSDVPQPAQTSSTPHHQLPTNHHLPSQSNGSLPHYPDPATAVTSTASPSAAASPVAGTPPPLNPARQSQGPIKRKPLSSTASALATRFSQSSATTAWPAHIDLPTPNRRFSRSTSIDSPTIYEYTSASREASLPPPLQ